MERTKFDRELEAVITKVAFENLDEVVELLIQRMGLELTDDSRKLVRHLIKPDFNVVIES